MHAIPVLYFLLACLALEPVAALLRATQRVDDRGLLDIRRADPPSNPLLQDGELPAYGDVLPTHIRSAVRSRLTEGRERLAQLESELEASMGDGGSPPTYESVMLPLQEFDEFAGFPWSVIGHLRSVMMTDSLREAVDELEPEVTEFFQEVAQSESVYNALKQLRESEDFSELPEARQRALEQELRGRRLSGVELSGDEATEFNQIQQELSRLSTQYSNNVINSAAAWNMTIFDSEEVHGIPNRTLAAAAREAEEEHPGATAENGPWLFKQDPTMLGPAITYAESSALREALYRAMVTEASEAPFDNTQTIASMLSNRMRLAALLGFENFAEKSLASKMAERQQVHDLLDELKGTARSAATADDEELRAFAKEEHGDGDIALWDRTFYATKLQQHLFDIDAEVLRPYFPFPSVVQGVFDFAHRHYDVEVVLKTDAPHVLWHEDARLYTVSVNGTVRGHLVIDPYSRPGQKNSGAWVSPQVSRKRVAGHVQKPLACIITNFPAPHGDQPALLALTEVTTLFHEFGHAMQHLLTVQNETSVSGINGVEWDAVEIASQFHEFFVHHDRATLYSFARHHETGEALPEDLYQRIRNATNFRAGTNLLAQVYMGTLDLRLHEDYHDGDDVHAIAQTLARETLVVQPLPEARTLNSFSHIFSGGYAAGYYSYQWSLVLAADAFSAFDEAGLENAGQQLELGRRWAHTTLAMGGGRAPADVFRDFRGRDFSAEPMLRYSGLAPPVVSGLATPEAGGFFSRILHSVFGGSKS